MKFVRALVLAAVAVVAFAGVASAHHVISIDGTVDCDGNYSVTVEANVFGRVSLETTLNGDVIGTETPGGSNADYTYTYTGSGASEGDAIEATVSDGGASKSGTLVLVGGPCGEVIPQCGDEGYQGEPCGEPTPTPTPTPTPSDSATPPPTLPPTDVASDAVEAVVSKPGLMVIAIFAFFAVLGAAYLAQDPKRNTFRDK